MVLILSSKKNIAREQRCSPNNKHTEIKKNMGFGCGWVTQCWGLYQGNREKRGGLQSASVHLHHPHVTQSPVQLKSTYPHNWTCYPVTNFPADANRYTKMHILQFFQLATNKNNANPAKSNEIVECVNFGGGPTRANQTGVQTFGEGSREGCVWNRESMNRPMGAVPVKAQQQGAEEKKIWYWEHMRCATWLVRCSNLSAKRSFLLTVRYERRRFFERAVGVALPKASAIQQRWADANQGNIKVGTMPASSTRSGKWGKGGCAVVLNTLSICSRLVGAGRTGAIGNTRCGSRHAMIVW